MISTVLIYVIHFVVFLCLGACIGSFLTMLTHRLPNKEDIVFKNSYCPKCGKKLEIKSLIPIVSYILQKGKCLECGKKISIRYPLIEITNCLMYCVLYVAFGFTFTTLYLCLLFSLLFSIFIADVEHMEIPLHLQFMLLIFAIIYVLFNPIDPLYSIFSAFVYFLLIEACRLFVEKIKHTDEVLGGADTNIITVCGLFLTLHNLPMFFLLMGFFGCFFAIFWKYVKKSKLYPFAVPIVIALFTLILKNYC